MTDKRSQLARLSTLVADTGDLDAIRTLRPQDATTNPSLLLAVARNPHHRRLLAQAQDLARDVQNADMATLCDCFAVVTGQEILETIPGVVSTEVDARLSFNTRATIERARRIIRLYRELGVSRERVLIKIATTWEGIRAAEVLEQEGIRCNLTLVFALEQALAAAEAGATLVSPFVGRILDWHVAHGTPVTSPENDPGVLSVRSIFSTLKGLGMDTIVMGASFRSTAQVEALAGCDRLTISPKLLDELADDEGPLTSRLDASAIDALPDQPPLTEAAFRWAINDNAMAADLLADGIRRFACDQRALEDILTMEPAAAAQA